MKTFLTGVKPTGSINSGFHLGNYVSIVKPIKSFLKDSTGYLFLADVHALNEKPQPEVIRENSNKMLATLISFFKDDIEKGNLMLYRQSRIPETFEISHLLAQFTPKGLLNRCHAYKTKVDANVGKDPDDGVNLGLFIYPHLMAVDILQLSPDVVPVGKDQMQHIEVTKELARVANNFIGYSFFKIPEAYMQTDTVLPGIDGIRKMSKSYNNTIPVFESVEKLKKLVNTIPTNFKNKGEPKFLTESAVCTLFSALAEQDEVDLLESEMEKGLGWGDIKHLLYQKILNITNDARPIYNEIMANTNMIDKLLNYSETEVRASVQKTLYSLKEALGC